jgi:hypothetical protein
MLYINHSKESQKKGLKSIQKCPCVKKEERRKNTTNY